MVQDLCSAPRLQAEAQNRCLDLGGDLGGDLEGHRRSQWVGLQLGHQRSQTREMEIHSSFTCVGEPLGSVRLVWAIGLVRITQRQKFLSEHRSQLAFL